MSKPDILDLVRNAPMEWKTLKEVTVPTKNIRWKEVSDSRRYIDLSSVDIRTNKIIETREITAENAPSRAQKLVKKDDVIFATTRPTQQRYCLIDDRYDGGVASTGYCVLRAKKDKVLARWILHWLSTSAFKIYVEENQSGSAYPAISDTKVKEFRVPIPSIELQQEIIHILDKITELTSELTSELSARQKQYEYYRGKLLALDENEVEWKTLGDVFDLKAGQHIRANEISLNRNNQEMYACYGGNGIRGFVQKYSHDGHHILIGRQGALCGNVQRVKGKFYATEHAVVVTQKNSINIDWAYHLLTYMNLNQYASKSAQPGLAVRKLLTLRIPVPTLDKQNHIATILDKFDTLTTSISEGLPREIELRQKQYEYYRDLLLSFPKPE